MSSNVSKPHLSRRRRQVRALVLAVVALVAILVVVVVVSVARLAANVRTVSLGTGAEGSPVEIADYSGAFDVLVVGSDGRDGQGAGFGEGGDVAGARNDVTLVLHVNESHTRATVLSFPRDLLVDFPDCADADTGDSVPASACSSTKDSGAADSGASRHPSRP